MSHRATEVATSCKLWQKVQLVRQHPSAAQVPNKADVAQFAKDKLLQRQGAVQLRSQSGSGALAWKLHQRLSMAAYQQAAAMLLVASALVRASSAAHHSTSQHIRGCATTTVAATGAAASVNGAAARSSGVTTGTATGSASQKLGALAAALLVCCHSCGYHKVLSSASNLLGAMTS
eukprot:13818-Heterococcus_DN1.PRE.1